VAISTAMSTSNTKSFDMSKEMLCTLAPNTFLTPISFMRCCVINNTIASKPVQESTMAIIAAILKRIDIVFSSTYQLLILSSTKEPRNSRPGSSNAISFLMISMLLIIFCDDTFIKQ
jgi:hypothetical protein